jgi:phosphopantetheinyl transferase (holo-ACP synthase)
MIGNDVVDLTDPETFPGATHARFDARVFTPAERARIAASSDPNRCRWRLWAAKESAYKVAVKLDPNTVFSPSRFEVRDDVVLHDDRSFTLFVEEHPHWIHAVAQPGVRRSFAALSSARSAVRQCGTTLAVVQSNLVRSMAIEDAALILGTDARALAIVTRDRIPFIEIHGEPAPLDLSLSHHGGFVAYALEPTAPS